MGLFRKDVEYITYPIVFPKKDWEKFKSLIPRNKIPKDKIVELIYEWIKKEEKK